jgi:hypothetical protein
MAGGKVTQTKLNKALLTIATLLNKHNITNWFIAYGTLLGIIRNNSCIDKDDDVDIICDRKDLATIKEILLSNNFSLCKEYTNKPNFTRTNETSTMGPIDIYAAELNDTGDFKETWENVIWSNCFDTTTNALVPYSWNNTTLYLPFNYETKLKARYGPHWKTPLNTKGPKPAKRII